MTPTLRLAPSPVHLAQRRGEPCGCHAEYETRFPGITETEDPHHQGCANEYPRAQLRHRRAPRTVR